MIARESPGANRRGRAVEKKVKWQWLNQNPRGAPRPPQWQRTPCDARTSVSLNFWEKDGQVAKPLHEKWKVAPPGSAAEENVEPKEGEVHESRAFKENHRLGQKRLGIGPVHLYGAAGGKLLASFVAGNRIPVLSVQAERLCTAELMALYARAGAMPSDWKRQTLRSKAGAMLQVRGVKHAGLQTLSWEEGGSAPRQAVRKTVEAAMRRVSSAPVAARFWCSRMDWRKGKARTTAQGAGGKNMRKVALEWSLAAQQELSEAEKHEAKTGMAMTMVEKNCHVRKIEAAKCKKERNPKQLESELKNAGCPRSVREVARQAAEAEFRGDPELPWPRPSPNHVEYVESITVPDGMVACGLDRNPKGQAVMSKLTYWCFMEDLYARDEFYYKVLQSKSEKERMLQKLMQNERRHRPAWLPLRRRNGGMICEEGLGFEYMNCKEKCLVFDAAKTFAAGTGVPQYVMGCPKTHPHVREVAVQGEGVPVSAMQSAGRCLMSALYLDPGFHMETRGLNKLGPELRLALDDLKSDKKYRRRCRKCGKEKKEPSGVLVRADVSQMFKRITRAMARGATRRLLRRVEKRHGCSAFWERRRGRQKPTPILVRKSFQKKGQRVWSLRQLKQCVEWPSTQVVSRTGRDMLVRVRGQPMGATLSPVKCAIVISECERRGWTNTNAAIAAGFVRKGDAVGYMINGKRIVGDVTVGSKVLCSDCVCEFLEKLVYKAPLAIEVEEVGRTTGVADLEPSIIEGDGDQEEFLDVYQRDKSQEYVLGLVARPKRIRWEPWLGHQTVHQIQQWLVGRFHDVVEKNGHALLKKERQRCGIVEAMAEMVLLDYPKSMIVRALKGIRNPALTEWVKLAQEWVETKVSFPAVEKKVQDAVWATRIASRLC